jgi:hypothetical protein
MRFSRTTILPAIAGAFLSARAGAQSGSDFPAALRPVPRDPSIQQSIERDVTALAAAPPHVIIASRWRVLVAFGPAVPVFSSNKRFADAIDVCRAELPASLDPTAFAAVHNPWAAFDSATVNRPLMVISVSRNGGPGAQCGDVLVDQAVAVARGLEFLEPGYVSEQNPLKATLRIGGARPDPTYAGRTRALRVRGGIAGTDTSHQLRLYFPLDEIRPSASGEFEAAELRITSVTNRDYDVAIPARVLLQVWMQSLPWRIDRAATTAVATEPWSLGTPGTALPDVDAALKSGDRIEAARRALPALASRDAQARRFAHVLVGMTLKGAGDTTAAAAVFRNVLATDPCLGSSSLAAPGLREALTKLRPPASCVTRSAVGVFARGLAFPGLGQSTMGRRGRTAAIATAAILGASGLAALKSRQDYSAYRAATTTESAALLFDSAENYRTIATGIAFTGATLWLGSAIEAAWRQGRNNASVRSVENYGGRR